MCKIICTVLELRNCFLYFSKYVYVYALTFVDSKLFICRFNDNCLHLRMGEWGKVFVSTRTSVEAYCAL